VLESGGLQASEHRLPSWLLTAQIAELQSAGVLHTVPMPLGPNGIGDAAVRVFERRR
jgi:hypothetical protein